MASNPSNRLPSKYEIARPLTYDSFAIDSDQKQPADSEQKPSALQQATIPAEKGRPEQRPREPWSDADKDQPAVKAADADKFEPPTRAAGAIVDRKAVAREKRAIWIVHGMGQQIPFETVDSLTRGLLDAIQPQVVEPRLRTVKIGNEVLQRVELDIDGKAADHNGQFKHYELHLYESYWAPKTEGVAKLTDVVTFLWDGGLRGILNFMKGFRRAMFGGMAEFSVTYRTPFWLCLSLLILVALTVINGVVWAAAAARTGLTVLNSLTGNWETLSALASCMIAVAFSFGTVLFISDMSKPQSLNGAQRVLLGVICWVSAAITVVEILMTALLMAAITYLDWNNNAASGTANSSGGPIGTIQASVERIFASIPNAPLQGFATMVILGAGVLVGLAMIARAILQSSEKPLCGHWALLFLSLVSFALNLVAIGGYIYIWRGYGARGTLPENWSFLQSSLWVWPFLIFFSAKVREVMVQYVGDVAIYVRANKLDRFDEVRSKIKAAARSVASAVFTAYEQGSAAFLYDHVAVVGHSLGSVIAYDTLNRLMLDDWLSGNALQVAERTKTIVTFGSPLNKTAFLFTIEGKDSLHIRERLACTVQPLIISYPKFRKLKWINVYSRNDIVSGKLEFYDLPGFQNPPVPDVAVQNVIDKDAAVPIVAHVAYWKNKTVWNELLSQIAP